MTMVIWLADIDPNAIESMNVLKGAAIYQAIKEKF
jgi:hypothetical protein